MITKKTFALALFFPLFIVNAAERIADFKPLNAAAATRVIFSEDFEADTPGWTDLGRDYRRERGEGVNGTGGMYLTRKPGARYYFIYHPLKLEAGRRYRLSAMCKIDGLLEGKNQKKSESVEIIGLDFMQDKKWIASCYPRAAVKNGSGDWQKITAEFHYPANCNRALLCLFLKSPRGCRQITWDNIVIEQLGEWSPQIYPVLPKNLHPDHNGYIKLRVFDYDPKRNEKNLVAFARINGKEFASPVRNGFAEFKVGKLSAGEHSAVFSIGDKKISRIIGEKKFPMYVTTAMPPAGAVTTEEDGRILVDGKPFFPLGFFFEGSRTMTEKTLAELREIGANVVLPYVSIGMRLPDMKGKIGIEAVKKSLDVLHRNGFKIVFSLLEITGTIQKKLAVYDGITDPTKQAEYIITGIRNHPALLAWYISDENLPSTLDPILKLRFTVNRLDPFHPAATLTDIPQNYLHFGPTGDLLMVDKYPVRKLTDEPSMSSVRECFELAAKEGRLGCWFIPQCFNWGLYSRRSPYHSFRYPTELEIRSQCLLALNHRARAVIFYAHNAFAHQGRRDPIKGAVSEHWPRTANVVRLLRKLEPFFLEVKPPVPVKVKAAEASSRIEAKMHTADGKQIVVVTADGPGKADAVLYTGKAGLKSRFGFTVDLGNGNYRFTSKGISSDILE